MSRTTGGILWLLAVTALAALVVVWTGTPPT